MNATCPLAVHPYLDHDSPAAPLGGVDGAHAPVREVQHISQLLEIEVEVYLKVWYREREAF